MADCGKAVAAKALKSTRPAFTGKKMEAAKEALKSAILMTDDLLYKQLQQELPTRWEQWKAWTEANLSIIGRVAGIGELQERIDRNLKDTLAIWELQKNNILWPAVANGGIKQDDGTLRPLNEDMMAFLLCVTSNTISDYRFYLQQAEQWSKGKAGSESISQWLAAAMKRSDDAMNALKKILDGLIKLGGAAGTTIGWLPWIIGGALILPFALRTFSAYKRGGAAAAADEAAGSIERGRSAAGSAIATGARKLATRGMAGMRRRRR